MITSLLNILLLCGFNHAVSGNFLRENVLNLKDGVNSVLGTITENTGLKKDDLVINRVHFEDAMISQSVVYTFKIDLNGEKTELSLTEDTKGKSYLFPEEDLLNSMKSVEFDNNVSPLVSQETFIRELPPVEIAGPIELRIEGSRQLRLAMPHDVEAGEVRKLVLSEGTAVTIYGAQEISLVKPLQLPLPWHFNPVIFGNIPEEEEASGLKWISRNLQSYFVSKGRKGGEILSLRVTKPRAVVSSKVPHLGHLGEVRGLDTKKLDGGNEVKDRIKVKRISPTCIKLHPVSQIEEKGIQPWIWPSPQLNKKNKGLVALEKLILSVLGKAAHEKGFFRVLSASAKLVNKIEVDFEVDQLLNREDFSALIPGMTSSSRTDGKVVLARLRFKALFEEMPNRKLKPVKLYPLSPIVSTIKISSISHLVNGTDLGLPPIL